MSHGGKRPGAGRRVGYRKPDALVKQVALRLSREQLAKVRMIGRGNASEGIRRAIDRARLEPEEVDAFIAALDEKNPESLE